MKHIFTNLAHAGQICTAYLRCGSQPAVCRDMTSGKLPKDGYLLGDVEIRGIIEAFAEDNAIFQAVSALSEDAIS